MAAAIPETSTDRDDGSFRKTPLRQLRVLFVRFLQGLFNAAPIGSYHWDIDDSRSEILVTSESGTRTDVINKRPLISLTRGPITFYSVGIDDLSEYDFATGRKVKDVIVPGTMVLNCCSRVLLECEDLAWIVGEHMWLLRGLMMRTGLLYDVGKQPQIGAPSPAGSIVTGDGADEFTVVAVTIPFQMNRRSAVTPLNQKIVNNIQTNLFVRPSIVVGNGPPLPLPYVNVHECPPPPFSTASDAYNRSPDPAGVRDVDLLKRVRHPLDPAKTVFMKRVYPNSVGSRGASVVVPIPDPCVEESLK